MAEKILFLDIDGPLVNERSCRGSQRGSLLMQEFDPIAISLVNKVCESTGAVIVISSSWRLGKNGAEETRQRLLDEGISWWHFRSTNGVTPVHQDNHRGREIQEWLRNHSDVVAWCALDDDCDFLEEQKSFLVQVDFTDGLRMCHFNKMLEILGEVK